MPEHYKTTFTSSTNPLFLGFFFTELNLNAVAHLAVPAAPTLCRCMESRQN